MKTPVGIAMIELRSRMCWTQSALAAKLGVSAGSVTRFETSSLYPSAKTIAALADLARRLKLPAVAAALDDALWVRHGTISPGHVEEIVASGIIRANMAAAEVSA